MDHYELNYEWDENKSIANLEKHGIDFFEACDVWLESVVEIPLESEGEDRYAVLGRLHGEYWTVFYTPRNGRKRIFSARRSSSAERSIYDRANNNR